MVIPPIPPQAVMAAVAATPYGLLPMLTFSRFTSPLFKFLGGYTMVHFLRSNVVFNPDKPDEAKWLSTVGGSIYDGKYTPAKSKIPTLSEDFAYYVSSSMTITCVLFLALTGAGVTGLLGASCAMAFDGEAGRERYRFVKAKLRKEGYTF